MYSKSRGSGFSFASTTTPWNFHGGYETENPAPMEPPRNMKILCSYCGQSYDLMEDNNCPQCGGPPTEDQI